MAGILRPTSCGRREEPTPYYAKEVEVLTRRGFQRVRAGTVTIREKTYQLYEWVRKKADDPANGDRGAIVNHYSSNFAEGGSGTDNNGNLLRQENYIPGSSFFQDNFTYDALSRLTSIAEKLNGAGVDSFSQTYSYDRWGNRTISSASGTGINGKQFTVDTNNNRLGIPSGQSGAMVYDNVGNLTTDTYSAAAVTRLYDAENRMTKETQAGNVDAGIYWYDGDGRRVKRKVGNTETWQVYGVGGELIAEYAANAAPANPQKEYGYRNGELLITATVTTGWGPPPSYTGPNPLSPGNQIILENLTELRSAVNSLRQHAGLSVYNFTVDATPVRSETSVKADHIRQLRTALEQARAALGLSTGGYAHPTLTENSSLIYALDFQELRDQITSAWQSDGSVDIRWLVADQLGTPRMIFDQSGSLGNVSRHDYLPFGEELFAGTGGRTTAQGYSASDSVRQKFTGYEHDSETGLEFAQARYHATLQGRFTSPDPGMAATDLFEPQSWNGYSYVLNNPVVLTDPSGMEYHVGGSGANDPDIAEFSAVAAQNPRKDPKKPVTVKPKPINLPVPDWDPYYKVTATLGAATAIPPSSSGGGLSSTFGPGSNGTGDVDGVAEPLEQRSSVIVLFSRFLTGIGPRRQRMGPGSYMTDQLKTSPDVAKAKQIFLACVAGGPCTRGPDGLRRMLKYSNGYYGSSAEDGPWRSGTNMPRQFVGGFEITIIERSDGTALFTIDNDTGVESGSYHVLPNAPWSRGPLSTTHQTYWWNEKLP